MPSSLFKCKDGKAKEPLDNKEPQSFHQIRSTSQVGVIQNSHERIRWTVLSGLKYILDGSEATEFTFLWGLYSS